MNILHKIFSHAPKANNRQYLAWMADLYKTDDVSAIELATAKMDSDFKSNAFDESGNLETLFSIDEKTHTIVERITRYFVQIESIGEELKMRISNAAFSYHQGLFSLYLISSRHCSQADPRQLQILLARALRNAIQMIKWRHYYYQVIPGDFWLRVSELLKLAEQFSLLNAKIQSYSDQEPVSICSAYIQVCMLGSLDGISFKPPQIELIGSLLAAWSSKISIDTAYETERHQFYINTADNSPAKRIKNFQPASTCRYWTFDEVNSRIELCILLMEHKITPKQPFMKELVSKQHALHTLKTLNAEWSHTGHEQQRGSTHYANKLPAVGIAYGFNDICNRYKHYRHPHSSNIHEIRESFALHQPTAAATDKDSHSTQLQASASDAWIINQSGSLIDLEAIKQAHEVVSGMLVGIRYPQQKINLQLGLIKHITALGNGKLHLSVDVASHFGVCVELENVSLAASLAKPMRPIDNIPHDTGNYLASTARRTGNFTAIYVPREQSASGQETLVIPKLQYSTNDIFRGEILGEHMLIKLSKIIASDENWARVTFTTGFH